MNRLTSYVVNDLVTLGQALRVVFLLESPQVSEVIHKHPLAGTSGKNVTKWMLKKIKNEFPGLNSETPFGCHLKGQRSPRIGLMNCSLLPMGKSAYSCSISTGDSDIINGMELIRNDPIPQTRKKPKHKEIEQKIIASLTSRLNKLPDSVLIVPCGDVARAMIGKTNLTLTIYEQEVPHPSRNNWLKAENKGVMKDLGETLRTCLGVA